MPSPTASSYRSAGPANADASSHAVQRTPASAARAVVAPSLRASSFAEGERALAPRENLVQLKAVQKKGASTEKVDVTFNGFYAIEKGKAANKGKSEDEIIELALKATIAQIQGGMPPGYVPPPRRQKQASAPSPAPDTRTSEVDPLADVPDVNAPGGSCEDPSVRQSTMPKKPNVLEQIADLNSGKSVPPQKGGKGRAAASAKGGVKAPVTEDSTPEDTPGGLEAPLKKVNILGGAELGLKVDGTGAVEISLVKKNGNPIAVHAQTPIPGLFAEGEVEWKAGIFGKGGGGKWEIGGVAAADLRVTMNVGVPGVMSAYAGLKLSTELKLALSGTYDIDKADIAATDGGLSASLSGAFVVGGKLDQAGVRLEKEFGKTEFATLSWMYSTGAPQVTPSAEVRKALEDAKAKLEQAQQAGEKIVDGAKDAAGWVWDNVLSGPSHAPSEEEQAEQERRDSHSDTDDGAGNSHG